MDVLRIQLFGTPRVRFGDLEPPIKMIHSVQALLAFLVLHRDRAHPREVLAGRFWGDYTEERARSALNTTLWRLRRVLARPGEAQPDCILITDSDEIAFNRAAHYWLDVGAFEKHTQRLLAMPLEAVRPADVAAAEKHLRLYHADLLEGFYDDWALRERERLRLLRLKCLARLMQYHKRAGAYDKSLACGQEILSRDPLREEIHREVMRLYLDSGQRAMAVRQYQVLREVLAQELGIEPMEETQALFRQMTAAGSAVEPVEPALLLQALQQLQHAVQALAGAQGELQRAVQRVETLAGRLEPAGQRRPDVTSG